jgi:hypothetical protein
MSLRCSCPHCGRVLTAPDDRAGKRATCPACRQKFLLPGSSAPPPVRLPATALAPPPLPMPCPGCGRLIALQPDEMSTLIECAQCLTRFVPGASVQAPAPVVAPAQVIVPPPAPQPQLVYQQTEYTHRSRNLWQWFVGMPVGVLLLTVAGLILAPFCCCGGAFLLGLVKEPGRGAGAPEAAGKHAGKDVGADQGNLPRAADAVPQEEIKPAGGRAPGPYPESTALLVSLRKVVAEPGGLEVIDWGEVPTVPDRLGRLIFVLTVRARNPFGAKERQVWQGYVKEGEVVWWHRNASDSTPGEYITPPGVKQ